GCRGADQLPCDSDLGLARGTADRSAARLLRVCGPPWRAGVAAVSDDPARTAHSAACQRAVSRKVPPAHTGAMGHVGDDELQLLRDLSVAADAVHAQRVQ